jgi:hypothetical protein
MAEETWEQIADLAVDAGVVWIGDPCYTMTPDTPYAVANTWQDFVARMFERKQNRVARWTEDQVGDIGVAVESGVGDGVYPVFVRRLPETGQVGEVRVVFDGANLPDAPAPRT